MLGYIDISCYYGHWPFYKIYKTEIKDIVQKSKENGIDYMLFSSINAIFYRDPMEGDEELHKALHNLPYGHILTVNPSMSASLLVLSEAAKRFCAKGVRIYPGYHDYTLKDQCVDQLVNITTALNLPLIVNLRVEDERLNHIVKPRKVEVSEIQNFLTRTDGATIILSNIYINRMNELNELCELINSLPNVYFDTCGLKDTPFIYDTVLAMFPALKVLYGSQTPLYAQASSMFSIFNETSAKVRKTIFHDNPIKVFRL